MPSKRRPPPPADPSVQLAIRFDAAVVARIEALAQQLSRPGLAVTRSDALRVALMAGLASLEHPADGLR